MSLEGFCVCPWAHQFEAQRRHAGSCAMTRDRKHPSEAEIGEDFGLIAVGEEPSKLNAPLGVVGFVDDLFGARELLVTGGLAHRFSETAGGQSGEGDGIKVLGLVFRAQVQAYGGVGTRLTDSPPQSKKFFSCYENTRLIEESWWQSSLLQHRRHTNSRLLQF